MAALTAIAPVVAGVSSAGAAVAASDTIAQSQLGQRGAYLEIINNGAGTDTMTISDHGSTPAGNALASNKISPDPTVANAGASKIFLVRPEQVNPATGLVTVTHTVTASVTYKLYPIG
jgi:hypothetical protein